MSSYAEFLRESSRPLASDAQEETVFPVRVPHSRPRGTWGQWMKEITIPQDALDSLVRRYDSKSWSATGGRSTNLPSNSSARTAPAAGGWRSKPTLQPDRMQQGREVSKEGGAMRGVGNGAKRPKSSGRARALRLRAESSLDYQRPGVVGLPSYGSLPCWNFTCTLLEGQFNASKLTSLIAFQTSLLWLVSLHRPPPAQPLVFQRAIQTLGTYISVLRHYTSFLMPGGISYETHRAGVNKLKRQTKLLSAFV